MKSKAFFPAAIAVLLILIGGCAQPESGIFYTLEKEIKLNNRNLDDSLSVNSIALFNNHYFISAGTNKKLDMSVSPTDANAMWTNIAAPSALAGSNTLSTGTVTAFGKLYSAYVDANTGKSGLFSSASDVNVEWTPVPVAGFATDGTMGIDGLVSANGKLFVMASRKGTTARTYFPFVSSDGVVFSRLVAETSEKPIPFIDADFDGTNYLFMTADALYSTADPAVPPTVIPVADVKRFGGIGYATDGTTGNLFVSTRDGRIFRRITGAWTPVGDAVKKFDKAVLFTDFAYYVTPTTDILFVGTEGSGYYEISGVRAGTPKIGNPVFTGEGFSYSDLNTAVVRTFAVHPAREIVFLGTSGNGLWQNLKRSDGIRIWQQE